MEGKQAISKTELIFIYLSPTSSHAVSTIFLGAFFGVFWKQITPNNRQGTSQLDSSRRSKISLYFLPDLCLSWRLWFLGYHNLWPNWRNNWELCQVDGLLVRTGDLILVRSSHIHREVKWKDNSRRNENNDNHSCKQTKGDKKHQRRTYINFKTFLKTALTWILPAMARNMWDGWNRDPRVIE